MKKIILITIISLMMLVVLVSALVININKNIELTEEQEVKLGELNLENYNVTDYEIGTEQVERCLNQKRYWEEQQEVFNKTLNSTIDITIYLSENVINACQTFKTHYQSCLEYSIEEECIAWEKLYYTEEEMINILNNWEEQKIKLIANTKINRDAKQDRVITKEGVTTIK